MKKKRRINRILSILLAFVLVIIGININFFEDIVVAASVKTSNMLLECMPYYLEDSTIEDSVVMGNVTYSDAIKVSLDSGRHERRIGFNLSRLYNSLSFEVGHIDGTGTANDNIVLSIYKDGELCDNYDLSINDIAKKITCDVLGVSQFEIVITYDYYTGVKGYFGIGALNFQRSGDEISNGREIGSEFLTYCPPYSYDKCVLNQTLVMGGVTYTNAIRVSLDSGSKQRTIAFNLQEKYNSLAFSIGHIDDTGLANDNVVLSLYGDGIFMDSYDLQLNDIPKLISCDTTGISQFEIIVDYDYYTGVKGYFGIGALKGTSITRVETFKIDSSVKGAVGEEFRISGTLTLSQDSQTSSSILSSEVDAIEWSSSDSDIIDSNEITCRGVNAEDNHSATLMITVIPKNEGEAVITGRASNGLSVSCKVAVEKQKDEDESRDYQYKELNNGTLVITGYTGTTKELVVPAKIGGKSVICIGYSAFGSCSSLSSIELPKGVTSIEESTFERCSNLNSIKLPEGITSIRKWAFYKCSSLSSIELPVGVVNIGESVFLDCGNLTLIVTKGSYAESYAKENGLKYSYSALCAHNYKGEITIPPTCTATGEKIYTCTECGDSYKESIPAQGHTYQSKITKATTKKNGKRSEICIKCRNIKSTATIYAAKTVKLSQTSYTYNGKVQKPSISIKDSKGKTLKNKIDYTVSYAKGRKNVGIYTVEINFKGNYQGAVKKIFTIAPKSTSITKLTPKKKGFTIKWNKQDKQTTGYEVAYSTSKKFKENATRTVIVNKNKTVSKSIGKLKAKKNYYVRIRTYKNVKTGGKTKKIYSGWSKVKHVITKK